jgi:hypothetical protein
MRRSSASLSCRLEQLEDRTLPSVQFVIDPLQDVQPISPFIYGMNQQQGQAEPANLTLTRLGGNRWTAYNWENNASNAGSDYYFENDSYLGGGSVPGGAVIPTIQGDYASNQATLFTMPINGYVAADMGINGVTGPPADVRNSGSNYLQTRFRQELPFKNAPFTLTPDPSGQYVYQDEFVNWVKTEFPYGQSDPTRPIWFSLDNEPDLWSSTHAEVHPNPVTYAELVQDTTQYSESIKSVEPNALVFGAVNYGWEGFVSLQNAPNANGRDFLDYYLQQMQQTSVTQGQRLLDVLDVHFYTSTPTDPADTVQAPGSLWDPTYMENSWIAQSIPGAIDLLPRLEAKINQFNPGTKLSISEYNYGSAGNIYGAIAQADALGIFGREGLFAASEWPLTPTQPYINAAFEMYRNFDGADGAFGDSSIMASNSDVADTSIYASVDSADPNMMTLVAINKTGQRLPANMILNHVQPGSTATIYQLTSASTTPFDAGTVTIGNPHNFVYTMPAYSITTIRINLTSGQNHAPTVASAAQSSASPVTGISTNLSVLGDHAGGEASLSYTWAVTGTTPAPVAFSINGTNVAKNTVATFSAAGSYTFVVTIADPQGYFATSTVSVVVDATPTAINLTPANPTITVNGTQQFTAASSDQFGDALPAPSYTWSASAGTISTIGVFSALAGTGSVTITASAGGMQGSTTVAVVNQTTIVVGTATEASLCDVIATANADTAAGESVTVLFDASLAGDTIDLSAPLELKAGTGTLTIDGGGLIVTSGDGKTQNFLIDSGARATLRGLTIQDGNAGSGSGGGIDNFGTTTMEDCTLLGNTAGDSGGAIANEQGGILTVIGSTLSGNSAASGGGIDSDGTATIANTIFSANTATGSNGVGGAILSAGTLTLMDSVLAGNSAGDAGGGIDGKGTTTVTACTIEDNTASYVAGGINNVGTMTVTNSTLTGNYAYLGGGIYNGDYYGASGILTLTNDTITSNFAAYGGGGGIYMANGSNSTTGPSKLTLLNTLVAGNFASGNSNDPLSNHVLPFGPDIQVHSGIVTGSNTLIGDGQGLTGIANADVHHNHIGMPSAPIDPHLAATLNNVNPAQTVTSPLITFNRAMIPLANNGGSTPTVALTSNSLAIGAGGAVTTLAATVASVGTATVTVVNAAAIAVSNPLAGSGYVIVIGGETMLVTGVSGNTFTVVRGYDGTRATTHARGANVFLGGDQRGSIAPTATPDIGAFQTATHLVVIGGPADHTADAGQTVILTASVRGVITGVQWQISTDGGVSWSNIIGATSKKVGSSNGLPTASTGLVIAATLARNDYLYRVLFSGPTGGLYTGPARLTVNPALALGNVSTTQWTRGLTGFSGTMTISGGTAPYAIKAAAGLPPGLVPSISGNIISFTGTPTRVGTFRGSVTITDGTGATATRIVFVTINPSLAFNLSKLPAYVLNVPYAQTIAASGGTGVVMLSYSLDGPLPNGLAITPASPAIQSFKIKGTATAKATVNITVTATDGLGAMISETMVLT